MIGNTTENGVMLAPNFISLTPKPPDLYLLWQEFGVTAGRDGQSCPVAANPYNRLFLEFLTTGDGGSCLS
jgi:hypothetical protein